MLGYKRVNYEKEEVDEDSDGRLGDGDEDVVPEQAPARSSAATKSRKKELAPTLKMCFPDREFQF